MLNFFNLVLSKINSASIKSTWSDEYFDYLSKFNFVFKMSLDYESRD
jgi:hypothetical protein